MGRERRTRRDVRDSFRSDDELVSRYWGSHGDGLTIGAGIILDPHGKGKPLLLLRSPLNPGASLRVGKVGTGWSRTGSSQIRKQLDTVVCPKSKLTKPIKKPKATWVEPTFFADIEYRDITSEGLLRQSSFKGLKRN